MSDMLHWIWLSKRVGLSTAKKVALLRAFDGIDTLFAADAATYRQHNLPSKAIESLCDKKLDTEQTILETCRKQSITLLTPDDERYPQRLQTIEPPPLVLYVLGHADLFASRPALAIVGARNASESGLFYAETYAQQLAHSGMLIISGMANGIDSAAHKGALAAQQPTVAVLGCGPDVVYPTHKESHRLHAHIVEQGAIVSEYPPGTLPRGYHFPERNRIISGLSDGVFVIEGALRSGSGITAGCALEQGRMVFALPGRPGDPLAQKPNSLIKNGACLVDSVDDILDAYPTHVFKRDPTAKRKTIPAQFKPVKEEKSVEPIDISLFDDSSQAILRALDGPALSLEALTAALDCDAPSLLSTLSMLELQGVVTEIDGQTYRRVDR